MTGSFPVDLPHSSACFPNLLHPQNGRGGQISEGWIMTPVETMEPLSGRHVDHGEVLDHIAALTGDFTVPEGACGTWRALYADAAQLRDDLIEHIHIENNILFPRFQSSAAA